MLEKNFPEGNDAHTNATGKITPFWHPFANMAEVSEEGEIVLANGEGCEISDSRGNKYLDATAGLWYCNVGYGRESITESVTQQMKKLPAYSTFGPYASEPTLELCERISEVSPLENSKIFLTSGGSDAIDTAAKLVLRYWHAVGEPNKRIVIGRQHAYHGMHAYGTSLAGIPANVEGMGQLVPEVDHVPYDSVEALADKVETLGSNNVAAFIGEPVIGGGGVFPPPEDYWPQVAELCRKNNILLIADEVITGWGRLGEFFGCTRFGFEPDLIVFAKGITSGYLPLGGVIVGERVQEPFWTGEGTWFRHGYTYSGHATSCAAALANLEILQQDRLVERVADIEPIWRDKLEQLQSHPLVHEVRAIGLLGAIELTSESLSDRPGLAEQVVAQLRHYGVLTRALRGRMLQLSPPFTISVEQIDTIVSGIWQALDKLQTIDSSAPATSASEAQ